MYYIIKHIIKHTYRGNKNLKNNFPKYGTELHKATM